MGDICRTYIHIQLELELTHVCMKETMADRRMESIKAVVLGEILLMHILYARTNKISHTREDLAKGHPPIPPIALTNRVHNCQFHHGLGQIYN